MKIFKIIITLLLIVSFSNNGKAQITLVKKTVLEKQTTLKIPKDFKELEASEINKRYDQSRRPTIAFSNKKGDVTLTLDLKSAQINQDDLVKYQKNYNFMLNQYLLDKTKKSNDLISINNHKVGFFKLKMPSRTGMTYTLMFYTNIGNQMLTGSFTCPITEQKKWEATADEILQSLVVKKL